MIPINSHCIYKLSYMVCFKEVVDILLILLPFNISKRGVLTQHNAFLIFGKIKYRIYYLLDIKSGYKR